MNCILLGNVTESLFNYFNNFELHSKGNCNTILPYAKFLMYTSLPSFASEALMSSLNFKTDSLIRIMVAGTSRQESVNQLHLQAVALHLSLPSSILTGDFQCRIVLAALNVISDMNFHCIA